MILPHHELLLRLAVAVLLGAAIGWEREGRGTPAGLRTHLLVSLASATFALVSFYVAGYQRFGATDLVRFDAGRIASNIVVGIGFLGGGAILRSGMSVRGLTTAASLWLTAAVGLAAGGGMLLLAAATTAICLFTLTVLRYTVERPRRMQVELHVRLDLDGNFIGRSALVDFLTPVDADVSGLEYFHDLPGNRSRMTMVVTMRDATLEEPLVRRLEELPGLRRLKVVRQE